MSKIYKFYLAFYLCLAFCLAGCASLTTSGERYRDGLRDFKEGRIYFAVLNLQSVVKEDPGSPYAPQSAFAVGEHYFDSSDYYNSLKTLSDYIHTHPKDKGVVFAKLIIYKILTDVNKEDVLGVKEDALVKEIRKELFSQPLFLIFYDKKAPRSYKSLFKHSYLVYDYVDKIKVFRDDKIFLELSP